MPDYPGYEDCDPMPFVELAGNVCYERANRGNWVTGWLVYNQGLHRTDSPYLLRKRNYQALEFRRDNRCKGWMRHYSQNFQTWDDRLTRQEQDEEEYYTELAKEMAKREAEENFVGPGRRLPPPYVSGRRRKAHCRARGALPARLRTKSRARVG